MTTIEQKILASISVLNPDSDQRRNLCLLAAHPVDWDRVVQRAVHEGVAGLLYKNLLNAGVLETLDGENQESLLSIYYRTVSFNLNLLHDLKGFLHPVNEKGIRVVLLQGIDLLQCAYDDVGLRPMTDIDLWVLQKDYAPFVETLGSLGYEKDPVYPGTFRKGSTILDVHTHILWADRIRTRRLLFKRGEEVIFRDAVALSIEGQQAMRLSRPDQVLYLSLHALKHYANKMIWLVDIKALLAHWNAADWRTFLDRAKELGQENAVSYILFLLTHLVDYRPPIEALQLLGRMRLNMWEKKILEKRLVRDSLPFWAPTLLFSSGMRLHRRLFFFFEMLFPRPEILRQIFVSPDDQGPRQLYWKRTVQLFRQLRLYSDRS